MRSTVNLSDIVVKLLENRGIKDPEDIENFLNPDWNKHTHNPFHMKDMEKAVERIKKAIGNNEKIIIYSDYDCDGIPGGVVLYDFFKKIEEEKKKGKGFEDFVIHFDNYIPHRHNEGYGLNIKACEKFIEDKVKLLITVDLGITNVEEIKFLQDNGVDVILTDHHLPIEDELGKQNIPEAYAVVNTKQKDCSYPEKMLCGCATAWKLVHAFLVKYRKEYNIPEGYEKWWLDMVGISTVADMVPLLAENRVLAKYGLEVLRKSKRQGLKQLLTNAKVKQKDINEIDIGFAIAPRLNSASRMADPRQAFLSLLQNEESKNYAFLLEKYNNQRKKETGVAHEMVDVSLFMEQEIIIVGDKNWNAGILGLIASKIVDKTKKTTFVWGGGEDKDSKIMKGSVRAGNDGANVVQLMSLCKEVFEVYGGHEEAGGFAVHIDRIEEFKLKLNTEYKNIKDNFTKRESDIKPEIKIKAKEVDNNLYKEIQQLAPFGVANPNPTLEIIGSVLGKRIFGDKGQHVEINFDGVLCVKFNTNKEEQEKIINSKKLIGQLEWDNYKNKVRVKIL